MMPGLGPLHVVVGGLDELEEDVLDVLTHISGLGEGGGISDGKGDVQHAGQSLGQQGLAAAGGAEQEDVGLGQLDVGVMRPVVARLDPLVVVVDRDRKDLLGVLLADDVVVQELVDLFRLGQLVEGQLGGVGQLLGDDVVAQLDALIADVDTGTGDQLLDLLLRLPAEAALHQIPAISEFRHVGPRVLCSAVRAAHRTPVRRVARRHRSAAGCP